MHSKHVFSHIYLFNTYIKERKKNKRVANEKKNSMLLMAILIHCRLSVRKIEKKKNGGLCV